MPYRHRNHPAPGPDEQSRQKPMHVIESRQLQKRPPREHLQPTPRIGCVIPQHEPPDPVSRPRRQPLHPVIPPLRPVSGDQHQPTLRLRPGQQGRDVRRIVLPVAVQRGDPPPLRRPHPRHDGSTLPAAHPMPAHHDGRHQTPKCCRRPIVAPIVHIDDFVRHPCQRRAYLPTRGPIFSASLRTGTTTETSTSSP